MESLHQNNRLQRIPLRQNAPNHASPLVPKFAQFSHTRLHPIGGNAGKQPSGRLRVKNLRVARVIDRSPLVAPGAVQALPGKRR